MDLSRNERRLIELIFVSKKIARVDLAERSGMTGASVTRLIGRLIEMGLLIEVAERTGAQGQPRRLLSLRADRYLSAGITFSVTRMEVAIVDLAGRILASRSVGIETSSASFVAKAAQAAITAMLVDLDAPKDRLLGIGCSVPGNFGTMSSILKAHSFFPAFDDGGADNAFRATFEAPYYIENDGTAAALGEYVFGGRIPQPDPMFFIHIGHGVGGGAVIDGRPYRGVNGNACLPGVLYPYDQPRPSGQDLFATLNKAGFVVHDFPDLQRLPERANATLESWIERAGKQLRETVRVATAMFDPALIVLGGRLPELVTDKLMSAISSQPILGPSRGLEAAPVVASRLGPRAGAIGAACIPFFASLFSAAVADDGSPYLNGRKPRSRP
ncbi:ROK family protein (plasmid) [Neorhizobium galegae bv. officinalis bv. officinalis str. HAMBI 1141]|uniref:ROK family protein n=1 Tax=Neorhizobium galegae bv. officinalis bv. officinalis str. HAMBI 1141 TaxID=1028801 RepID=A0A068THQ3_NEOGA|nr:ROK family transcriptional regulator [Neorhizobium galegae]CDN57649.1 ROK family protein [Neorhizobium galegae bv. officinalis bv. officinalis str. HAMBI 1141]